MVRSLAKAKARLRPPYAFRKRGTYGRPLRHPHVRRMKRGGAGGFWVDDDERCTRGGNICEYMMAMVHACFFCC